MGGEQKAGVGQADSQEGCGVPGGAVEEGTQYKGLGYWARSQMGCLQPSGFHSLKIRWGASEKNTLLRGSARSHS